MPKLKDLTGIKFNRLTVIERVENDKHGKARWLCECDCGNFTTASSGDLKSGNTKSCGCFISDITKARNTKHGKSTTRIYTEYQTMKARCYYPKHSYFHLYGGRGITVCDEWLNDFQTFYNWAMSHGYADNLTIDRINTDGNYTPENCRWVTNKQQQNNRRNNRLITYKGETKPVSQWAEEYGIYYNTLLYRVRNGWSVEKALTTPCRHKKTAEKFSELNNLLSL